MSKILALLSGKGGSGKTTLALSISSLLSSCAVKTLLIDCDISTNGATYFYEEKLPDNISKQSSFYDSFIKDNGSSGNTIKINDYYDFLPSIVKITKESCDTYHYKENDYQRAIKQFSVLKDKYDIIILDCQAGYSDLLKILLPCVDINLVVMEADAISSSSIRSLYLKIGDLIEHRTIYQVFNKVTKEEYDTYSKISGGTFFTNIETIIFDWKIRKAFSIAQIPDMENTSTDYGEQVYNVCKVLFTEEIIQKKILCYEITIKIKQKQEQKDRLREELTKIRNSIKTKNNIVIAGILSLVAVAVLIVEIGYFGFWELDSLANTAMLICLFFLFLLILVICFYAISTKPKKERYTHTDMENINFDIRKIQTDEFVLKAKLEEIKKENETENRKKTKKKKDKEEKTTD